MFNTRETKSWILTLCQTISSFKAFAKSIETIYLVEASPYLQKQQAKLLSGTEDLTKSEIGLTAPCKYISDCKIEWCEDIRLVPKGVF
jgi:NADH dehydrogenase [ubiquinone] 1 alpha subcomplex assembly factor 7